MSLLRVTSVPICLLKQQGKKERKKKKQQKTSMYVKICTRYNRIKRDNDNPAERCEK